MKRIRAVILTVLLTVYLVNPTEVNATEATKTDDFVQETTSEVEVDEQETLVAPLEKDRTESNQEEVYYTMTDEEFEWACKIAYAEAGNQNFMGKVLVLNCSINNAKALGITLMEEFNQKGRYSSVIEGQVYLRYKKNGKQVKKLVTEDMITDEIRQAVVTACKKDYTEELLHEVAIEKGYTDESYYKGGARFFCNPKGIESEEEKAKRENISVSYKHGNHIFYLSWE